MTSVAVSLSVDARGPSALYVITDSRVTWKTSTNRWDACQKAFASRTTADIFGFCGDCYFPPLIVHQIVEQINSGLLFSVTDSAIDRHKIFTESLKAALSKQISAPVTPFTIYHGAREGEFMSCRFKLWRTNYSVANDKWYDTEHDLSENHSYLARIDGSGRNAIENKGKDWIKTEAKGTSRAAIWSFCEALASGADPYSGGAPQLVGLWRKGPAQNFGMIWQGHRYLAGLEVKKVSNLSNLQWFNELFERCDGETGSLLGGAQAHLKPTVG